VLLLLQPAFEQRAGFGYPAFDGGQIRNQPHGRRLQASQVQTRNVLAVVGQLHLG
jgi:hypothetical protein